MLKNVKQNGEEGTETNIHLWALFMLNEQEIAELERQIRNGKKVVSSEYVLRLIDACRNKLDHHEHSAMVRQVYSEVQVYQKEG